MTGHRSGAARSWLSPFWSPAPLVGVEMAPRRVTVVALERERSGFVVTGHATEALPPGAIAATVNATNIPDRAIVVEALRRAFERIGRRPKRIGLVIPDSVAKVSLVRFESVPGRLQDLDRLIRWQVRKTAPFRIEEAQVAYMPGTATPEGGREFVVTLTRRDVVEEYERVCADAGAHAGLVDLATFNLVNAALATERPGGDGGDWLLVHVTPEYTTIAILRGADLLFFRNRLAEGDGSLADLVHQTAMYYEDRVRGPGLARAVVAGVAANAVAAGLGDVEAVRRTLEDRLGTRVEALDPRRVAALRDRITAAPDLLDMLTAPLGLLLRERMG